MSVAELLTQLERDGVQVWVEGEHLRYRAPKGTLPADKKQLLVTRRPDVLAHLASQSALEPLRQAIDGARDWQDLYRILDLADQSYRQGTASVGAVEVLARHADSRSRQLPEKAT